MASPKTLKVLNAKINVKINRPVEIKISVYAKNNFGASVYLSNALKLIVIIMGVKINKNKVIPNLINAFTSKSLSVLMIYDFQLPFLHYRIFPINYLLLLCRYLKL